MAGTGPALTFLVAYIYMLGSGFGFILAALECSANHMEYLATHDGLTECLNRNAAVALLGNTLQRAQRTGESTSLVMLDLDHWLAWPAPPRARTPRPTCCTTGLIRPCMLPGPPGVTELDCRLTCN